MLSRCCSTVHGCEILQHQACGWNPWNNGINYLSTYQLVQDLLVSHKMILTSHSCHRPPHACDHVPRLPHDGEASSPTPGMLMGRWWTVQGQKSNDSMDIDIIIWLVVRPPLWKKNMKVNWDDDIPNIWEHKIDVPNHQPVYHVGHISVAFWTIFRHYQPSKSWDPARAGDMP